MRKRLLAVLLCIVMATMLLTGCGGSGETTEEKPDVATEKSEEKTESKAETKEEQITLKFMRMGSPEQATPIFEPIIEEYEKQNPNIKIEFEVISWAESLTKTKLQFSSDQFADVGFMPQYIYEYAEGGYLLDLTPYFEADPDFLNQFSESVIETCKYKGSLYGVPCALGAYSLWYNADLFEQAGLDPNDPPETWEELLDYAETIKQKTGIPGLAVGAKAASDLSDVYEAIFACNAGVGVWSDEEQRFVIADHRDVAVDAVEYMQEMMNRDIHQPNPIEIDFYGGRTLFRDHQVAMTIDGVWMVKEIRDQLQDGSETLRTTLLPSGAEGSISFAGIGQWCIPASCEHPDEAWKFIKFLMTPENQARHGDNWGLLPILEEQQTMEQYEDYYWEPLIKQTTEHELVGYIQNPNVTNFQTVIAEQVSDAMMGKQTAEETVDNMIKLLDEIVAE